MCCFIQRTLLCLNQNPPKFSADFVSKLQIALKEANETSYLLELLLKTNYIDEANYQELNNSCSQIRVMLIKSINTAKGDEK